MVDRPRKFRRFRLALVIVTIAALGLFGGPTLRVMYMTPSKPRDHRAALRAARLSDMAVDPDLASEAWTELCSALDRTPKLLRQLELERRATGDDAFVLIEPIHKLPRMDPTLHDREREVLDKLAASGVVETVTRTVERPVALRHGGGSMDRAMTLDPLPELDQIRTYVDARRATMRLAAAEGRFEATAAVFDELLGLAETLAHQPLYIDRAFAVAYANTAITELQQELAEYAFDEAACTRLLRTLETRAFPSLAVAIEGERARILDLIERVYSDDGAGDGRLVPSAGVAVTSGTERRVRLRDIVPAFKSRFLWAGRAETIDLVNAHFDRAVARAELAPPARSAPPFWTDEMTRLRNDAPFVFATVPGLDPIYAADECLAADLAGARVTVAAEQFFAREGRLPETLDELTPSILPAVPVDPRTDETFRYRRIDDDRFLLYGDGRDGVDDGGVFDPAAPRAGETAGTDMLIAPLPR